MRTIPGFHHIEESLRSSASPELREWIDADWNESKRGLSPTAGTRRFGRTVDEAFANYARPIVAKADRLTREAESDLKAKQFESALVKGEEAYLLLDSQSAGRNRVHTHQQWDASIDVRFAAADALVKSKDERAIERALNSIPRRPPCVPNGSVFDTFSELSDALHDWSPNRTDILSPLKRGGNVLDLPLLAKSGENRADASVVMVACYVRIAIKKGKLRDSVTIGFSPLYGGQLSTWRLQSSWVHVAEPVDGLLREVDVMAMRPNMYGGYQNAEKVGRFYVGWPIHYTVQSVTSVVDALRTGPWQSHRLAMVALQEAGYKEIGDSSRAKISARSFRVSRDYIVKVYTPGE